MLTAKSGVRRMHESIEKIFILYKMVRSIVRVEIESIFLSYLLVMTRGAQFTRVRTRMWGQNSLSGEV